MSMNLFKKLLPVGTLSILLFLLLANSVFASGGGDRSEAEHGAYAITFLWIAVILLIAKASSIIEKWGQPAVLGELLSGVLLGNLALLGIHIFDPIKTDSIIQFLAELGVVILLFQIGLESNIAEMKKVGARAGLVAAIGVIAPFILGAYVVGPWLLPGLDPNAYLFLGATLAATSVGITARVFKDLGRINSKEAKIVLGAAVLDDVLGLIILAIVTALVTTGAVSLGVISVIVAKAVLFLVGSVILGQLLAPQISRFFSKIHSGVAMKFTIAISFGLIYAYIAQLIGLAPIIGAFAAGLVLDSVHFRFFKDPEIISDFKEIINDLAPKVKDKAIARVNYHSHRNVEDIIEPVGNFLIPIFFVYTGINVNLDVLFDPKVLVVALGITAAAIIGKIISGLAVAKDTNRLIVGIGMVPRGEVGLIFATIGYSLGVVTDEIYSVIVVMVILTTLLTPPALAFLIKRQK
jgi:Kef-type K+ transport system membrane component KefB